MGLTVWICGLIGAGTVVAAIGVILLIMQLILLLRKRICTPILPCTWTKALDPVPSNEFSKHYGRAFTFKEVEECCEGFINLVGESQCYCVYKGILADGTEVAVKRMKEGAANDIELERNFHFQVDVLSRIRHQHLVNLLGVCVEKHHRMLIFQYAPNGSLFNSLHNDDEHLSWKQRMRIAVGTACGMTYLHHLCGPPIIHGDLTSHNILLTEDYGAKISGIGTLGSKSALLKSVGGCTDLNSFTTAARSLSEDVYSFGVLLLELVSRKLGFSKEFGAIVEWAGPFLQSRDQMMALTDPTLKNVAPLELYSVCEIARLCIQQEASSRPKMEDVLYMLVQSLGIGSEAAAPISSPVMQKRLTDFDAS